MSVDADPGDSTLLVVIESKGVIYDEVLHAPLIHMATLELGNNFLLESRNLRGGGGGFNNSSGGYGGNSYGGGGNSYCGRGGGGYQKPGGYQGGGGY